MSARVRIEEGVLHVDGVARFLLNTDYPYYRDDPANWRARLEAQRECGLDVVSCYVPWRHHAPHDPLNGHDYDFTGRTQGNRDLVGFLGLAHELELQVILKPGPFVHAELPFGGLPEYVCRECNPDSRIEPERDAYDEAIRWRIGRMRPEDAHVLPAPFDPRYNAYVRDYFGALARQVAAPRMWPRGPIIAFQILNEGIYSESSRSDPTQFAFGASTMERFHAFLRESYGDLASYNRAHAGRVTSWHEIQPPRSPAALDEVRSLLFYLDWSAFQGRIYADVAALYQSYLVEGGVPADAPIIFNFNPNGETYRQSPASDDGWYTRVNLVGHKTFAFGMTNWLGVVAGDERAFRQYVMANTAFRGPAMEMNWGFASEYYAPYEYVSPSVYEAMVALAGGATGITAYTFAGTRAWREDPNIDVAWIPHRTNGRRDSSSGDYPSDGPVLSTGKRTGKYWSLVQMAQYLRDQGPRFLHAGPRAPLAWGVYPPYAWAGQWLMRGDPDDYIWRPPLRAVPRAAYHGLDAFTEMCLARGLGFRQVDVSRDEPALRSIPVLAISAHEYMDEGTQSRLVDYVESGGKLLLTNVVPDRDERLCPLRGPLTALFPHTAEAFRPLDHPTPAKVGGETLGLLLEYVHEVQPPADADLWVQAAGMTIGYRRRFGAGVAIFLGASPWRAVLSGDDGQVAARDQALAWRLLEGLEDQTLAAAPRASGDAVAFRHGDHDLFLVNREVSGEILLSGAKPWGGLRVRSPTLAAHAIGLDGEAFRSCYLKGVTDTRAERVAPRLIGAGWRVEAEDACDLCVTQAPEGIRISVAHLGGLESTRVLLPFDADSIVDPDGRIEPAPDGVWVRVDALERHGVVTLGRRGRSVKAPVKHQTTRG